MIKQHQPKKEQTETIVLGGGCFWCLEPIFQSLKGVINVTAGYAGGTTINPTYEQVYTGKTGHAEVVKVDFDPKIINLADILNVFFTVHDPTSLNKQGSDVGPQYRSIILITRPRQVVTIQKTIRALAKHFQKPIATEIKPLENFYPAELYHQNYYQTNPQAPYCQIVISEKYKSFRQKFSHLLK